MSLAKHLLSNTEETRKCGQCFYHWTLVVNDMTVKQSGDLFHFLLKLFELFRELCGRLSVKCMNFLTYSLPNMFSFNRVNETMSFNRSAPMGKYRSFNWADFISVSVITEARNVPCF